jgi:Putative polyhydroxyalkanoic acid system protein (PHA_gran_rgn)
VAKPLVVTIPHKLGKDEALRRVKPALSKASESFPVLKVEHEVWTDDRMDFRVRALGQLAAGNAQVGADSVRLEVTLPWLLHKFAEGVQMVIAKRGQVLLEKK